MDERTDGRRRGPPQKSSSGLCPEELMIREQYAEVLFMGVGGDEGLQAIFIIIGRGLAPAAPPPPCSYAYVIQLPGQLCVDGSDIQTYRYAYRAPRVVAICEGSSVQLYTETFTS